jgi:hypothetical protein
MTEWEYMVVPIVQAMKQAGTTEQEEILNGFGKKGWELVSVVFIQTAKGLDMIAYFKREKKYDKKT